MPEKELRAKYGGKLAKAINRAIRAEIPEGNAALDKLMALSGPAASSGWTTSDGGSTPEAEAYLKHQKGVVAPMELRIRQKWKIEGSIYAPKRGKGKGKVNAKPKKRAKGRGPAMAKKRGAAGAKSVKKA